MVRPNVKLVFIHTDVLPATYSAQRGSLTSFTSSKYSPKMQVRRRSWANAFRKEDEVIYNLAKAMMRTDLSARR